MPVGKYAHTLRVWGCAGMYSSSCVRSCSFRCISQFDVFLHFLLNLLWFAFSRGSTSQGLEPASPVSALISRARLSLIWPPVCQSPGLNWQLICMLLSSHLLFGGRELSSTYSYHIAMRNISCYSTGGTPSTGSIVVTKINSVYLYNLAVSELLVSVNYDTCHFLFCDVRICVSGYIYLFCLHFGVIILKLLFLVIQLWKQTLCKPE